MLSLIDRLAMYRMGENLESDALRNGSWCSSMHINARETRIVAVVVYYAA